MDTRHRYIKSVFAIVFAMLAVFTPVAKNMHVNLHVSTEISGDAVSEDCPLCNIEFPAFEAAGNSVELVAVEREYKVFVPVFIGNLCDNKVKSFVIRGPPEV